MHEPGTPSRFARRVRIAALTAASFLPSPLHELVYRLFFGANFGAGVRLGFLTVLVADRIDVGPGTTIGARTRIEARHILIGGLARIGRRTIVRVNRLAMAWRAVLDDDVSVLGDPDDTASVLAMGMHSWIFPRCWVNVAREVVLGRNVGIGGSSLVFTHGYWLSQIQGFPVAQGPVRIRDDVWIPWNCTILPAVTIGSRVVVGAGAVVNRSIPDDALAAGVPARVVREKSRREMTRDQQRQMTFGLVAEFLRSRGHAPGSPAAPAFAVCGTLDEARAALAQKPTLVLVLDAIEALDPALRTGPIVSVGNGLASTEASLPAAARAFLQFARRAGVRYYPFDQYLASEQLMAHFAEDASPPHA